MSQSCCFHVFSCPGSWHSLSHTVVPHMPKAGQAFGNAPKKSALTGPRLWDRTQKAGGTIKQLQMIPISVGITSDGDKDTESRDLALVTCLQQGFVREGTRTQSQQVPLPRVCSAGEFFLSVVLKTQENTQIISTNPFQQMCSGSKRERICLNISVIQG